MSASVWVRFPGSEEWIPSPHRAALGIEATARWALQLASGRPPGKLYSRLLGSELVAVWTRRHIFPRRVIVRCEVRS